MDKAEIVVDSAAKRFDMTSGEWEGVDFSGMSDEELGALGIDPSEVERPKEDEEEPDEEGDLDDGEEGEEGDSEEDSDDEEEEEDTEEEDTEEEDTEEEEPSEDEDEINIPKARFDAAVRKERERANALEDRTTFLEEQIDKLIALQTTKQAEPAAPPAPKIDIAALEREYMEKVLSADTEEATAIRIKINDEQQRVVNELLKQAREDAKNEAQNISENDKFQIAIADAVNKYPKLDSSSDDYDEETVDQVNALAIGFQQSKKMTPAAALTKAVNSLLKKPVPKKPVKKAVKAATNRKAEKARKVASTPKKAKPSSVRDVAADDINWDSLSEDQFDKLYRKNPALVKKQMGL